MKAKGKKSDKKKAISTKTEDVRLVEAPVVAATTSAHDPVLVEAPIEVLPEPVLPEPVHPMVLVTEERRVITSEERRRLISLAAYYRAQRVGFGKTNPVEDWLLAEREIDAIISDGVHL